MSKDIIIQKNGVDQDLTVDMLNIQRAEGGDENWIVPGDRTLVNIQVKQNGTYNASDFNAYGIAQVKVKCTVNGGAAKSEAASGSALTPLNATGTPSIEEGGIARNFTADRVRTQLDGGGYADFVPEDTVKRGAKIITKDNKTYKAKKDGLYAYSQVMVSGISVTKSTDQQGHDIIIHTDSDGTKVYELPTSIEITRLPDHLEYGDRAYINPEGIVVRAYKESGELWSNEDYPNGIIPLDELIFDPDVTDYNEVHTQWEVPDLIDPVYLNYVTKDKVFKGKDTDIAYFIIDDVTSHVFPPVSVYMIQYSYGGSKAESYRCFVSREPFSGESHRKAPWSWDPNRRTWEGRLWTVEGHSAYIAYVETGAGIFNVPFSAVQRYGIESTAVLAVTTGTPGEPKQTIKVKWERPWDEEILETSFGVTVIPAGGHGDD